MADLKNLTKQNLQYTSQDGPKKQNEKRRRTWTEDEHDEKIVLIDPEDIKNWEFHDRPEQELGDIDALANEFKNIGQQQPCIIRCTTPGDRYKYELIVGERRWRASKIAKTKLKCIIKDLTDTDSALIQSAENDNRQDLSEYAKGISYARLIEENILNQKLLTEKLGRNKQYVSSLLSFSKIPKKITDNIGDMSKVSSRTAETIKRLSNKGDEYIDAILEYSQQIGTGKIGSNKLSEKVINKVKNSEENVKNKTSRVNTNDGRHIFTWRDDNNHTPSIHFPKEISDMINKGILSEDKITNVLKKEIENELTSLNKSARAD